MESFEYSFGISVAELVLRHGDNLSATLQSSTISAAEDQQHVASLTTSTIAKICTNEIFRLFWEMVQNKLAAVHVNEPRLHRCQRAPAQFEAGDGPVNFPAMVEAQYRQIYFES